MLSIHECDAFEVFIHFSIRTKSMRIQVTPWHQLKHNFIYKCVEWIFPSERKSTHPLAIVIWLGCKQKWRYTIFYGVEWQCTAMAYDSRVFISVSTEYTSPAWLQVNVDCIHHLFIEEILEILIKKITTKYWLWAKEMLLLVNTQHPECCYSSFFYNLHFGSDKQTN